jgi:hypothetical protein
VPNTEALDIYKHRSQTRVTGILLMAFYYFSIEGRWHTAMTIKIIRHLVPIMRAHDVYNSIVCAIMILFILKDCE